MSPLDPPVSLFQCTMLLPAFFFFFLAWVLGVPNEVLMLIQQALYPGSHHPSPGPPSFLQSTKKQRIWWQTGKAVSDSKARRHILPGSWELNHPSARPWVGWACLPLQWGKPDFCSPAPESREPTFSLRSYCPRQAKPGRTQFFVSQVG